MNSLITKSLESSDIGRLLVFPTVLMSSAEKKMVDWIRDFTIRHSGPPRLDRFLKEFDVFVPIKDLDPLGDIFERELTKKRNLFTREYLMGIQDELKKGMDPTEAIGRLYNTIRNGGDETILFTTFDRTEYLRTKTAYPYGIGPLDKNTGGAVDGDLIYVIGRLGSGKSTFTLWMTQKWFLEGHRILVLSNEMRADDVVSKLDSFIGGWNPLKKRTADWSEADKRKLAATSYVVSRSKGEVIIPKRSVKKVSEIQGLIHTYRPDMVVVDGVYLMEGEDGSSTWERVTDVSRTLKKLAVTEGLPIVGVHQANRQAVGKRVDVENASYSDAIGQDADLILGINQEPDDDIYVEGIKNRWGGEFGFFIRFFFDTMHVRTFEVAASGTAEAD